MMRVSLVIAILLLLMTGCSGIGGQSPPPTVPDSPAPSINRDQSADRFILAAGEIHLEPDTLEAYFIHDKDAAAHYDVTHFILPPDCDDCLTIEVMELVPSEKYIKLKVAIRNPTHLTAHDVRGIVISNSTELHLVNADSYTKLWDDNGQVTINPFKAFATDWPYREIPPDTAHARVYEIKYPSFSELMKTHYVFDASWPGNCREPYEITNAHTTGIFLDYNPQGISCEVYSWHDDVSSVTIDLTCLGWGKDYAMTYQDGNVWVVEDIPWHSGGYGPGTYAALITAESAGSSLYLYNYVDITIDASPPTIGWARTWGGPSMDPAWRVATDAAGNIYVAGDFCSTVDFDTGPDVDNHTSNGSIDVFLSKFNPEGQFQWARTWGGKSTDRGYGVATDNPGNAYVTGYFTQSVDFDPGPWVDEHTSNGSRDAFLCKIGPDGAW